ncbi:MAG TPA: DUF2726 domain-containing protein [Rhodocyclaceae bacterium]|nr:DUF2726 domain-containing protein [Rhodocyclaceae bacterium]
MNSLGPYVWLFVALAVIGALVATYVDGKRHSRLVQVPQLPPFVGRKPLTTAERKLYFTLQQAMPECIVLAKVALSSLVDVSESPDRLGWLSRISRKSVDFVLCLPDDFTVVAVIELDRGTGEQGPGRRLISTKERALSAAGHPMLRFKANAMPTADKIRTLIAGEARA